MVIVSKEILIDGARDVFLFVCLYFCLNNNKKNYNGPIVSLVIFLLLLLCLFVFV